MAIAITQSADSIKADYEAKQAGSAPAEPVEAPVAPIPEAKPIADGAGAAAVTPDSTTVAPTTDQAAGIFEKLAGSNLFSPEVSSKIQELSSVFKDPETLISKAEQQRNDYHKKFVASEGSSYVTREMDKRIAKSRQAASIGLAQYKMADSLLLSKSKNLSTAQYLEYTDGLKQELFNTIDKSGGSKEQLVKLKSSVVFDQIQGIQRIQKGQRSAAEAAQSNAVKSTFTGLVDSVLGGDMDPGEALSSMKNVMSTMGSSVSKSVSKNFKSNAKVIYQEQINGIEQADPAAALNYLNENKDTMIKDLGRDYFQLKKKTSSRIQKRFKTGRKKVKSVLKKIRNGSVF